MLAQLLQFQSTSGNRRRIRKIAKHLSEHLRQQATLSTLFLLVVTANVHAITSCVLRGKQPFTLFEHVTPLFGENKAQTNVALCVCFRITHQSNQIATITPLPVRKGFGHDESNQHDRLNSGEQEQLKYAVVD